MGKQQAPFQYTEEVLVLIEKYLSPERLAAYVVHAKGDRLEAMKLYERNTALSEGLYGVLQGFEVTLRNAIHNIMKKEIGAEDWYEKIMLEPTELAAIQEAKDKIRQHKKDVIPPRVVAELTFGFWVRLTASAYEKTLWVKYLYRVFPLRTNRKTLWARLDEIKRLRNRIAHHEHIIFRRDLEQEYKHILETTRWINPIVANWVESTNCFEQRLAEWLTDRQDPESPNPKAVEK